MTHDEEPALRVLVEDQRVMKVRTLLVFLALHRDEGSDHVHLLLLEILVVDVLYDVLHAHVFEVLDVAGLGIEVEDGHVDPFNGKVVPVDLDDAGRVVQPRLQVLRAVHAHEENHGIPGSNSRTRS